MQLGNPMWKGKKKRKKERTQAQKPSEKEWKKEMQPNPEKNMKRKEKKKTTKLERAKGLTMGPSMCVCIYKNVIITLFP